MTNPTFKLGSDGRHFSWEHRCNTSWGDIDQAIVLLPLNPASGWTLVCTDPMTVTPSILCSGCGTHGFITNGAWVPC